MIYIVRKLLAAGGGWTVGTGGGRREPNYEAVAVVQERDNGGVDWMVRSSWILEVELIGFSVGLGTEMREWSNEIGI